MPQCIPPLEVAVAGGGGPEEPACGTGILRQRNTLNQCSIMWCRKAVIAAALNKDR
jgi:hypothetical protein